MLFGIFEGNLKLKESIITLHPFDCSRSISVLGGTFVLMQNY